MKRFLAIALAASLGLVLAGSASAGTFNPTATTFSSTNYAIGNAANGIGMSRHNLGGFSDHVATPNTTEICVFCHTPHHTNKDLGGSGSAGPIWNRGIDAGTAAFSAYGTTIAGSTTALEGSSLACLSCHDGVTTFDNIVNAPGKGGLSAVAGEGVAGTWTFVDGGIGGGSIANNGMQFGGQADTGRLNIGDGGGGSALNAGAGLSNDHPVGVTYAGTAKASLRADTTLISTIDLKGDLVISAGVTSMDTNLWAVAGFISDTAHISDLLRGGKVECASCHDPHFNNKSWTEIQGTYQKAAPAGSPAQAYADSNGLFLRRVGGNTGSGVCRTCHEK